MATLGEMLASALGAEPTEVELWRATRSPGAARALATRLVDMYSSTDMEPLPAKPEGFLRPAFLSDYHGRGDTPYDREFSFVQKSLCYADEVAVVDEVHHLAKAADLEKALLEAEMGGFPECTNLTWSLRRIAKYAQLESEGLVRYVEPIQHSWVDSETSAVPDEAVRDLAPLVAQRNGWAKATGNSHLRDDLVRQELRGWFGELYAILDHVAEGRQWFDLYLPQWFAGPELLEWEYRKGAPPEWLASDSRERLSLTQLISLPAPSGEDFDDIAAKHVGHIRESNQVQHWRAGLTIALQELDSDPGRAGRKEFRDHISALGEELRRGVRRTPRLREVLKETIETGVVTAGVAEATGQDLLDVTAVAAAPVAYVGAKALFRWLLPEAPASVDIVRDPIRASSAVRTFLNEPWAPGNSAQRPPSGFMQTLDGRPVAFDLLDGLLDGN